MFADVENGIPRCAPVSRLEDTAVTARAPERTLRSDENCSGIVRVDDDLADVFGLFQPHVLPTLAAILRPIDTVAVCHAALTVVFTRTDPHNKRIVRVKCHATNRVRSFSIKDWLEGSPGIRRFPHTPRCNGNVPFTFVVWIDCEIADATGCQGRTKRAEFQSFKRRGRHRIFVFSVVCFFLLREAKSGKA